MRTKSLIAALLLMVAGLQTASAQGFRVYKSDGTFTQFSFRTDSIVFYEGAGEDVDFGPFTPVNQMIIGTWYKTKSETITFGEDGTTDYVEGATYEFLPYQGTIIFYNASDAPTNILKVYKATAERMIVGPLDGSGYEVLTRAKPVVLVSGITLSETSLTLQPDEMKTLTATVLPEDADNPAVTWESSDGDVAEVNGRGRVIANGIGTCTITCRATDGSGVYAECFVIVRGEQPVTGITLSQTSLSLWLPDNKTQTLTATVTPSNATNKNVIWSSNKTNVATIDQSGKVTAVGIGSCVVTATAEDGSGVTAECVVTVVQLVTGITLNKSSLSLSIPDNKTYTLTATVTPSNATNKSVTWSSSNTSVATVDQSGKVTAVSGGSCTITATAADDSGVKGNCSVSVEKKTQGTTNGHDWVDLDLPSGTLWATCNVGASSPESYGNYYAWGETSTKSTYNWDTYKYCRGSESTLTKYCTNSNYGTVDNKTVLESADDAATSNWGSSWQMPSEDQVRELVSISYTSTEWTTQNGVNGRKITSKSNGKSIFLPAAGYRNGTNLAYAGGFGYYWSRSLDTSSNNGAWMLNFDSSSFYFYEYRYSGLCVRPVRVQTR